MAGRTNLRSIGEILKRHVLRVACRFDVKSPLVYKQAFTVNSLPTDRGDTMHAIRKRPSPNDTQATKQHVPVAGLVAAVHFQATLVAVACRSLLL